MNKSVATNRDLKESVRQWLGRGTYVGLPGDLTSYPARRLINPLISFLYAPEALVKWHAVTAIGELVAGLADTNLESARVIMRRFMWTLNDESGGIGWGAPESMAEIMARHQRLAQEFGAILISYLDPDGNYLEHEGLQPGALWGVGRLARVKPHLMGAAVPLLPSYLASEEADIRGQAAWAARAFDNDLLRPYLKFPAEDDRVICLYRNRRLERIAIREIVVRSN